MKRVLAAVVAVAVSLPLALGGGGGGCPGLEEGKLTGPCTISGGLVQIDGSLAIPAGTSLVLQDGAVLRFTNEDDPVELVVSGTLDIRDAAIEAAEDVDLTIRFEAGSVGTLQDAVLDGYLLLVTAAPLDIQDAQLTAVGTALHVEGTGLVVRNSTLLAPIALQLENADVSLEGTTLSGGLLLDDTARLEVSWFVRVVADLSAVDPTRPAVLTVRGGDDQEHSTWELGDGNDIVLLLRSERHGGAMERFGPYRFILVQGLSAMQTEEEPGPDHEIVFELPGDHDDGEPVWPADALQHSGARPGFSHDGVVDLAWAPADDTLDGDRAHRALDHYRVLLGEDEVARTRSTQATMEGLPEGWHAFTIEAVDLVGNSAASNTLDILVDKTPPAISFGGGSGAHSDAIDITATATEQGEVPSGLAFLRWRIGDGPTTIVTAGSDGWNPLETQAVVPLTTAGNHSLRVTAEDEAGNRVEEAQDVVIDTDAPSFLARVHPRLPAGAWHGTAPELRVDILDAGPSGNGTVQYRVEGGDWLAYDGPTVLDDPGEHLVQVRVADAVGNMAQTQLRIAYDPDAPLLDIDLAGERGHGDWFVGPVRVDAAASDDVSGMERLEYRIANGVWRPLGELVLESSAEHRLTLRATDAAGNQAIEAVTVAIDQEPPTVPIASWMALPDGRVRGDWSQAPPADGVSGIAEIIIGRADAAGQPVHDLAIGVGVTEHIIRGLPNGEHLLRVRVIDDAGNEASTPWTTVNVENSTAATQAAQKVRGAVTLHPTVEGPVEARFYVDGVLLDATATEPHAVTWHTRASSDGLHEVRIVAVDEQGLHHEEVRSYNVRNGYAATLADHAFPAAAAMVASLGAVAVASVGFVRWRRWAS